MLDIVLFVAGLVLGGAAIYASRPAPSRAPEATPPADGEREKSLTPVTALLADDFFRAVQPNTDVLFLALPNAMLDDLRQRVEARTAVVWRLRGEDLVLDAIAGDRAIIDELAPALAPMLAWTARERVAQLGPDGDAPRAALAPLIGVDGNAAGVIGALFAAPVKEGRAELKRVLQQAGDRVGVTSELVRTHAELAKTNKRTRMLLRETQNWDVEERPADLGVRLCAMIEQLTGADGAALVRWEEEEHVGEVAVADGTCAGYAGSAVDEDSLAGTACREDVPQIWHEVSGRGEGPEALFSRALPTQTGCVLVQPLRRRSRVIGAVVATHKEPGALGPMELRALSLFDAVASFRLASAWKLEEVTKRALVDGLTGLTNRDGFELEMKEALGEQMRFGWETSLVIVDVDHFKTVNDTHGHEVGDMVLRAVAQTLEDGVRTTDVCARVGGEEMALILKDTGVDGARELAERLRVAVEALRVPFGGQEISVTASFGVATYPTSVGEWAALYRMADRSLYDAKAAGRNTVRWVGASQSPWGRERAAAAGRALRDRDTPAS
ncbi:MAG TPA: sensor domain-containing diguanylate cyclase [Gemmatimonadaceae bacterium]|nr:sensor domain-containing diguanylate cyclase [Gemmatimonadaceae bacterium]